MCFGHMESGRESVGRMPGGDQGASGGDGAGGKEGGSEKQVYEKKLDLEAHELDAEIEEMKRRRML